MFRRGFALGYSCLLLFVAFPEKHRLKSARVIRPKTEDEKEFVFRCITAIH
jgi:hypothetical protein